MLHYVCYKFPPSHFLIHLHIHQQKMKDDKKMRGRSDNFFFFFWNNLQWDPLSQWQLSKSLPLKWNIVLAEGSFNIQAHSMWKMEEKLPILAKSVNHMPRTLEKEHGYCIGDHHLVACAEIYKFDGIYRRFWKDLIAKCEKKKKIEEKYL